MLSIGQARCSRVNYALLLKIRSQTRKPDVTMTHQHFTRKQCRHSGMHAGANQVWTVTMTFLCW